MNYNYLSGFLGFGAVTCFSLSTILHLNNKRQAFASLIYKNKIEDSNQVLMRKVLKFFVGKTNISSMEKYIDLLGYINITPERLAVYSILIGLAWATLFFSALSLLSMYLACVGFVIGIMFGMKLPLMYLELKYEKIQEEKQMGILPYIEMLEVACEAGLTLTLAIERVYEYYPSPLALEFKKANNDFMANIRSRRQSLHDIIDRVGGDEIRFLIESIMQSLETGTPMRNTLKMLTNAIRRDMRKKIITTGQKAKWKNFIVSICFQFPPYIFIIAGPSMIGIINSLD